jgi:hypothetical protein
MTQEKLYRCCNTCKHNTGTGKYHGCEIKDCFNGFSAYEPNEEMIKQKANTIRKER